MIRQYLWTFMASIAAQFAALPPGNSWTNGAPMPVAVTGSTTGVIGGKVYVVGGATTNQVDLNQIYDPATDVWTTGAPLPTARYGPAGAVVNNILYVIGGKRNGNQVSVVEAYDPLTDTWSTKAPMPTARDSIKGVVNNGIIYVLGGFNNGGGRLKNVESYNPATDTWTKLAPLLTGKSSFAAGLLGSTILAAAGLTNSGATGDNEAYDVSAGTWKSLTPDPTSRWDGCSASIAGQLYYAGGRNNGAAVNAVEAFNLSQNQWTKLAPMPVAAVLPAEATVGNLLYCFGGSSTGTLNQGVLYNNVQIYHPGGAAAPVISSGGIVSASAFGAFTTVAPGSWIEIYGSSLAPDIQSWVNSFNGIHAPTQVEGTSVTIGGKAAFIDFVSPGQVDVQVPSDVATGSQQVTVETLGGTSNSISITVNAAEPGILAPASFNIGGIQYAAALFTDNAYVLQQGAIAGLTSRPAKPGDTVIFYGVGFGPVIPATSAGQIVQGANGLAASFHMSIGGTPAVVSYAGLTPGSIGLYQFNVVVPNIANSIAAAVTFTLGDVPGTQMLAIPVQN